MQCEYRDNASGRITATALKLHQLTDKTVFYRLRPIQLLVSLRIAQRDFAGPAGASWNVRALTHGFVQDKSRVARRQRADGPAERLSYAVVPPRQGWEPEGPRPGTPGLGAQHDSPPRRGSPFPRDPFRGSPPRVDSAHWQPSGSVG